jgi:Ca2+-binding EF-hand superfamily protein
LKNAFKELDLNNDGRLSKYEVKTAYSRIFGEMAE